MGGLFLIQTWPPFWGRPLGGSKRGSVPWSQQFDASFVCRCQRLLSLSVATRVLSLMVVAVVPGGGGGSK